MPFDIHDWNDIKDQFDDTILLGNGASIAVDERFNYGSLLEHATEMGLLTDDVQSIFDFFGTDDFELILRNVWQATNINEALKIEDQRTREAYQHIRECLIQTIRDIHPNHDSVAHQIPVISGFLKNFNTVISLNYDLVVYWAMMLGNDIEDGHSFKDCFSKGAFDDEWWRFREPIRGETDCTLVFYPHGNLIFARDKVENEIKLSTRGNNLVDQILENWEAGSVVPLFVSEGTTEQKAKSIQSSYYLNTTFRGVLTGVESSLVIYGWGMGEHDMHILDKLSKSESLNTIAISIWNNSQADCNRMHETVVQTFDRGMDILFFDCESAGCWNKRG